MKKSKYVILAENTISNYIKQNKTVPKENKIFDIDLLDQKSCFVSIHTKDGALRGCIGTISPYRDNLYEEILYNSIAAATEDPRFLPISEKELEELVINVDVLSEAVLEEDISKLNPKKYGIIVSDGYRRGVLLPDLEGIDSIEDQISIAKNKAGIYDNSDNIKIYKFTVDRYY